MFIQFSKKKKHSSWSPSNATSSIAAFFSMICKLFLAMDFYFNSDVQHFNSDFSFHGSQASFTELKLDSKHLKSEVKGGSSY